MIRRKLVAAVAVALVAVAALTARSEGPGGHVILVTLDGLRWQEVFGGAEASLMTPAEGVAKPEELKRFFWRETPEARRETLLPFLWGTVAKRGQIHGNKRLESSVRVTNGRNFSYPGYNELLAGFADPGIDSNDKRPNANVTVLEWLAKRPGFEGRIAAFGSWDVFPYIINRERSGILVNAGWEPVGRAADEARALGDAAGREIPAPWNACRFDVLTAQVASEHLLTKRPRVLYLAFGETDEWAHLGRYQEYLVAAQRTDLFLARLWDAVEKHPELRGRTSIVITTDHGRGDGPAWRHHNADVPGAEDMWLAVMGPRTPALGEVKGSKLTQSQVAATVAALAGEDYRAAVSRAAVPIAEALGR